MSLRGEPSLTIYNCRFVTKLALNVNVELVLIKNPNWKNAVEIASLMVLFGTNIVTLSEERYPSKKAQV